MKFDCKTFADQRHCLDKRGVWLYKVSVCKNARATRPRSVNYS